MAVLLGSSGVMAGPVHATQAVAQTPPGAIAQVLEPAIDTPPTDSARFGCQLMNGAYTVVYYPQSQPGQAYPWATPTEMGGGWTPERRCSEISRRLEEYRPDGLLEMQTSIENGYDIVCVTTQQNPGCRIVFTVPQGQDAVLTRDRVFENLTVADTGQQTDSVTTFTERSANGILNQIGRALDLDLPALGRLGRSSSRSGNINLRPFLDQADGGTGDRLRGGTSTQPGQRLDPNQFR